jgi:hypothetical protein
MEEVVAKTTGLDLTVEVTTRGGEHAGIDRQPGIAPAAADLSALDRAEELRQARHADASDVGRRTRTSDPDVGPGRRSNPARAREL